jgi:hypothetical protein
MLSDPSHEVQEPHKITAIFYFLSASSFSSYFISFIFLLPPSKLYFYFSSVPTSSSFSSFSFFVSPFSVLPITFLHFFLPRSFIFFPFSSLIILFPLLFLYSPFIFVLLLCRLLSLHSSTLSLSVPSTPLHFLLFILLSFLHLLFLLLPHSSTLSSSIFSFPILLLPRLLSFTSYDYSSRFSLLLFLHQILLYSIVRLRSGRINVCLI